LFNSPEIIDWTINNKLTSIVKYAIRSIKEDSDLSTLSANKIDISEYDDVE
jgi:hypothetical protein